MIMDPIQAYLGANVDMNRANEIRPLFRNLSNIAERTGCAIVLIGHLNKASGSAERLSYTWIRGYRCGGQKYFVCRKKLRKRKARIFVWSISKRIPWRKRKMMCLEELEAELQAYEISARTGRDARKDLEDQLIYGWYQSRKTISLKKDS